MCFGVVFDLLSVLLPTVAVFFFFLHASPIKEGLQKYGEGCDGREYRYRKDTYKLRNSQCVDVFLVESFS